MVWWACLENRKWSFHGRVEDNEEDNYKDLDIAGDKYK